MWLWLLYFAAALLTPAYGAGAGAARLVCYVETARVTDGFSECTHLVYAGDARGAKLDTLLKDYKKNNPNLKVILRISEVDKDLRSLLKSKHVQGLEIYNAHKSLNKTMVLEIVGAARSAVSSSGGGPVFLSLPAHPELMAKYYDLRTLIKKADLMMVETHNLGLVKKMTYHPSRLSGMWDMMNTDSVVDLVIGLGVPASKVVISLPATARQFTLANETLSTPGSPTVDDEPKEIDQAELCRQLRNGRWTLERDQDLSAPYAFKNKTWISFEDSSSVDVKGKYARVRGLAGLALHRAERDVETGCGPTLRATLAKVLNQQSRAPRAAVLRSLEHEILSAPSHVRALNALQVSPYRITQIVDADGVIHSVREDTRTEFSCSRQGYFVHPRSCARFYRCVKFDQLSPEYTVFEFDCPAGLAFDSRYEVCVWPGSLPYSQACPGSSEIAPVPKTRFICPEHEGYYADPENCRWFFACLDHGTSPLTAYEFRCPFGLGFDAERLKCDWPWLVPNCGNIGRYEAEAHGFSAAILTGAAGFHGQTADAVNVAAHQSLVSGASLDNLVGIQGSFLTKGDALDSNFIASQELSNTGFGQSSTGEISYQAGAGLVRPTQYDNRAKYTSGSIILDDYRLPTKEELAHKGAINNQAQTFKNNDEFTQSTLSSGNINGYNKYQAGQTGGYNALLGSTYHDQSQRLAQYQNANYNDDQSGAYVHDPSGDYAEPYKHIDSPTVPYIHDDAAYKHTNNYYDFGKYSGSSQGNSGVQYAQDHSGQYTPDNLGAYVETNSGYHTNSYNSNDAGAYIHDDSGKFNTGVYRADGHIGKGKVASSSNSQIYHGYGEANAGNYINNAKAYTGLPHILKAGAINVGLVGKTTLIDADYSDQGNYFESNTHHTQSYNHATHTLHPAHVVSHISQPAVSINHVGTDGNNLDGYSYVTTPTSSGIPTTATPFAVTTSLPVVTNYKTTFIPKAPKTSVKQIFGISQPAITYVQPNIIAVKQSNPQVHVTDHNQGINYQYESKDYSSDSYNNGRTNEESGYIYSKPSIKFEDGDSYSTAAPAISVSTYKPEEFSHNQQTYHNVESVGIDYSTRTPVQEEPFKKIVAYTTGPSEVSYVQPTSASYIPQSFSHQTIHKVESSNTYAPSVAIDYEQSKSQITYEEPKIVHYTTPKSVVAVQPAISTYHPHLVRHEKVHKIDTEAINTYTGESGYSYKKPSIEFEEVKNVYTTPAPIITSTYKPQTYVSHQTIHKATPQKFVTISTTPKYQVGYQSTPVTIYENPLITQNQKITPVTYTKPTYESQAFSHQTIHKVENTKAYSHSETEYQYTKPAATFLEQQHENYYTTAQPAVTITYQPQVYSSQTIHKVDSSQINTYSEEANGYQTDVVQHEQVPKAIFEYSTPAPVVTTTYQPHLQFSHETLHKVDGSQVNTYAQDGVGYEYKKPAIKFIEQPESVFEYSTATPIVASTYKPQSYNHQTIHQVESQKYIPVSSTDIPKVDLTYQKAVTTYQNPFLKYTQRVTPVTYVQPTAEVYTQTYKPIIQQHEVRHFVSQPIQYQQNLHPSQEGYSYSQPEIQRDVETNKGYSDASLVSRQYYHQSNVKHNYDSDKFIVSTSPSTLIYENHHTEYESPKNEYKGFEYIPPKNEYKSYSTVSTVSTPVVQQSSIIHQRQQYVAPKIDIESTSATPVAYQSFIEGQNQDQIQDNYNDKGEYYSQQYEIAQKTVPSLQRISFSTSHDDQSQKSKSVHVLSPSTLGNTQYQRDDYELPQVQVEQNQEYNQDNFGYKEDYSQQYETADKIPSTQHVSFSTSHVIQPQIVESVHFTYPSTTAKTLYQQAQYQAPEIQLGYKAEDYLPPVVTTVVPIVTSTYRPKTYATASTTREYLPPSTTSRPILKSTTPSYRYEYTIANSGANVVNYESFGYNNARSSVQYNPQEVITVTHDSTPTHKHNIVVEKAKSNLLGFGTVGPDAGLVSEAYTTATPIISSTYRQKVKSTTPIYKSTTEYQAPEYLPPSELDQVEVDLGNYGYKSEESYSKIQYNPYKEATVVSDVAPINRKQNIVVKTAKSRLLGYGTVGPDAGLISSTPYTTSLPTAVSNTESYSLQKSSTYAPVEQGLFEVTPSAVPVRRTKPKVAVVTKINDFNPFLVRKLGAVCSCQSPVLILKGRRPTHYAQNLDNYDARRGDIDEEDHTRRYTKVQNVDIIATPAPVVATTFNPIIVPDDSYYQDLQDYDVAVTPKHAESYISSTPIITSTTRKPVRVRSRVKSVTIAPTYQSVLLNQEVTPTITIKEDSASAIDTQAFDRYGPGGWRSRDETLQGTVDCKRAGLFRHPKQCNKFYACRWDCTKERFTLHIFNCPIQLSFDPNIGACNWPSQGPSCQGDTLLTNII